MATDKTKDSAPPKADKAPALPALGSIVCYLGDESNGREAHPAIVTGLGTDGTLNLTVFFDGSAPSARRNVPKADGESHPHAWDALA